MVGFALIYVWEMLVPVLMVLWVGIGRDISCPLEKMSKGNSISLLLLRHLLLARRVWFTKLSTLLGEVVGVNRKCLSVFFLVCPQEGKSNSVPVMYAFFIIYFQPNCLSQIKNNYQ